MSELLKTARFESMILAFMFLAYAIESFKAGNMFFGAFTLIAVAISALNSFKFHKARLKLIANETRKKDF